MNRVGDVGTPFLPSSKTGKFPLFCRQKTPFMNDFHRINMVFLTRLLRHGAASALLALGTMEILDAEASADAIVRHVFVKAAVEGRLVGKGVWKDSSSSVGGCFRALFILIIQYR
jgi:hypothetical protein